MNFIKTIVAGLVAVSTSTFAADITGAGATFPVPIYSKWADAYKEGDRQRLELPVDRLRCWHQADPGWLVTFGATDAPLTRGARRTASCSGRW